MAGKVPRGTLIFLGRLTARHGSCICSACQPPWETFSRHPPSFAINQCSVCRASRRQSYQCPVAPNRFNSTTILKCALFVVCSSMGGRFSSIYFLLPPSLFLCVVGVLLHDVYDTTYYIYTKDLPDEIEERKRARRELPSVLVSQLPAPHLSTRSHGYYPYQVLPSAFLCRDLSRASDEKSIFPTFPPTTPPLKRYKGSKGVW